MDQIRILEGVVGNRERNEGIVSQTFYLKDCYLWIQESPRI